MIGRFVTSAVDAAGYPPTDRPEIAILGRSNVGKSSLLNALVRSRVARTSKTPGRTQMINFFDVDSGEVCLRLADLPGYGFAKVPRAIQASWPGMVETYLKTRENLVAWIMLVDLRHEPQPADHEAAVWVRSLGRPMPTLVVGTKADRVPVSRRRGALERAARALNIARDQVFLSSAATEEGLVALRNALLDRVMARGADD